MDPGALALNVVSDVPSALLISADHGPPSGSLNEPRPNTCDTPSTDVWSAGGVTVGGVAWVRISQAPQPIVPAPRRWMPGMKSRSVTLVLGRLSRRVQVVPRSFDTNPPRS